VITTIDVHSNLPRNKGRGGGSIDLVVPVLRRDDDAVVADVVALVADDEDLGGGDAAKGLVAVCIAECYNCQGQY
jgi:hypothetical protein